MKGFAPMAALKVKLLSHTAYPVETYYLQYMAARTHEPLPTSAELYNKCLLDPSLRAKVRRIASEQMALELSVSETIWFVFAVENICIALREQLVRHRVGHEFGGLTGVDMVPGPVSSTFWSQTTRLLDMSTFADDGRYLAPDGLTSEQSRVLEHAMSNAQESYVRLEELGVHRDVARTVLPTATQHRMTWTCNLMSLKHVLRKRSCWIAQLGIWEPLITGVITELRALDPLLARIADPPCIKNDKFALCPFVAENLGRVGNVNFEDPSTPCPLYLHHEEKHGAETSRPEWVPHGRQSMSDHVEKVSKFREFWQRDPYTGDPLSLKVLNGNNVDVTA